MRHFYPSVFWFITESRMETSIIAWGSAGSALSRCNCIGFRHDVWKGRDFFQIIFELENSVAVADKSHCWQTIISFERKVNFLYRAFALHSHAI